MGIFLPSLQSKAMEMFDRMSEEGIKPGPEHYNPYLMMLAANGQLGKAKEQLATYYGDARFSNPDTESFNSLLAGHVKSIQPLGARGISLAPWVSGCRGRGAAVSHTCPHLRDMHVEELSSKKCETRGAALQSDFCPERGVPGWVRVLQERVKLGVAKTTHSWAIQEQEASGCMCECLK